MTWYQAFNLLEAVLWWIVAAVILIRCPRQEKQQLIGVLLAVASFGLFGISDILEAYSERQIPLWLWGLKCLCGGGILASRYTWLGWSRFRGTDREFLFGLLCLIGVIELILIQHEWIVLPVPA